ncbi:MurR/RpiR family transcriptional regulator [Pelagibius sp. Alg239-R121]|uniref:MurR/RpiR family transcriptional regulator n=1 Tax=Pelagibius sp. Alg239-R121 TaxID=2993448 RepID=UPI0024A6CA11|nr:MurR/RpiR family transcriptional regulator [Pelagibius sp. Alg239-R121]
MTKGIALRLQEKYGQLRKSERLVADYLKEHQSKRLEMSITEFANTLDISEATISRFTRALGYKGFADMKLALASESISTDRFVNLPAEMNESDPLSDISFKLLGALSSAMTETQKHLIYEDIQRVVSSVLRSSEVVFLGVGGAVAVCEEAVHLFLKAGVKATCHRDGYTQQVVAATSTDQATFIGVSHTGTTEDVAGALKVARTKGAMTIAITSNLESPVSKAAEISLWTWTPDTPQIPLYGDFLEGRICQIYIIYMIYLGVLFQSKGAAPRSLEETASTLKEYFLQNS